MKSLIIFFSLLFIAGISTNNLFTICLVALFCGIGIFCTIKIFGAKKIYRSFYRILQKYLD